MNKFKKQSWWQKELHRCSYLILRKAQNLIYNRNKITTNAETTSPVDNFWLISRGKETIKVQIIYEQLYHEEQIKKEKKETWKQFHKGRTMIMLSLPGSKISRSYTVSDYNTETTHICIYIHIYARILMITHFFSSIKVNYSKRNKNTSWNARKRR